ASTLTNTMAGPYCSTRSCSIGLLSRPLDRENDWNGLKDYGRIFNACKRGAFCVRVLPKCGKSAYCLSLWQKTFGLPDEHRVTFDETSEMVTTTFKNKRRGAGYPPAPRALFAAIDDCCELLTVVMLLARQFGAVRADSCDQFCRRDFITHFTVDARLAF